MYDINWKLSISDIIRVYRIITGKIFLSSRRERERERERATTLLSGVSSSVVHAFYASVALHALSLLFSLSLSLSKNTRFLGLTHTHSPTTAVTLSLTLHEPPPISIHFTLVLLLLLLLQLVLIISKKINIFLLSTIWVLKLKSITNMFFFFS